MGSGADSTHRSCESELFDGVSWSEDGVGVGGYTGTAQSSLDVVVCGVIGGLVGEFISVVAVSGRGVFGVKEGAADVKLGVGAEGMNAGAAEEKIGELLIVFDVVVVVVVVSFRCFISRRCLSFSCHTPRTLV